MVTRILHISDLHFPSRDADAARILADEIVARRPSILVVSGDLVDHPSVFWPWGRGHWLDAKAWLQGILEQTPHTRIFILPGNHDVLFTGLIGWCWPAVQAFRHLFKDWCPSDVYYDPEARLAILTLDTNPRLSIKSGAEGKVLRWRLRRLRKALESHTHAGEIQSATKILLMHHHPLPVPFQGSDFLLHTRRSDRLVQFLAERHIDLVLHGHKHFATWSNLRLGGATPQPFFIEVLGAGTAMKSGPDDRRGYNFNLIDINSNGMRNVRQFFLEAGTQHFEEATPSPAEQQVGDLVQSDFRLPYRMRRISWELHIDEEGDGRNRLTFEGVVFNRKQPGAYDVLLPMDTLDAEGTEVLPYRREQFLPPEFGGKLISKSVGGVDRSYVSFNTWPTADRAATAIVGNYYLNNYVMDQREAGERGFQDPTRDIIEYYLSEAVDELNFSVTFPPNFPLADVKLEVLEPVQKPDAVHQRLQAKFGNVCRPEAHVLTASLRQPPANFRYSLSWGIPPGPQVETERKAALARRTQFELAYLELLAAHPPAGPLAEERVNAIAGALGRLFQVVDAQVRAATKTNQSLLTIPNTDLSFIVCDRSQGVPRLRMVFSNQEPAHRDFFRGFRLWIGEGNAGRAYKTGTVRVYDKQAAKDNPKAHTYKFDPQGPVHQFLLSFPLLDPWLHDPFPMGILSLGTTNAGSAVQMRALDTAALGEITAEVQKVPGTLLLHAAGLQTGV